MKIHVTIPRITYDILCRFGDINEVVNKICDLIVTDQIPYQNIPALSSDHKNDKQFDAYITNELFIELYTSMQEARKPLRLRRILQYFVDNEMYVDFCWSIVNDAKRNTDKEAKNISTLCNVTIMLNNLKLAWPSCEEKINNALVELREVLNERRQRFNERERKD